MYLLAATQDFEYIVNKKKKIPKIEHKISRVLQYRFVPKGCIVFNEGDISDRMYFILEGNVSLLIKKTALQFNQEVVEIN